MILLCSVKPTHFRDSDYYKCTSTDTDRTESLRQGRKYLVWVPPLLLLALTAITNQSHHLPLSSLCLEYKFFQFLSAIMIRTIIPALSKLWQKDCHNFKASMNYIARLWCSSSPQGKGAWREAVKEKRKEKRPAF